MKPKPVKTEQLSRMVERLINEPRAEMTIRELLGLLGERAFGAGMLAFALLCMIPGASAIFAIPLLFITAQLAIGRPTMWLPAFITRKTVSLHSMKGGLRRAKRWLIRAERLMKPRYTILCTPAAERLVGIACLVLSIILFLPIPLANFPPAIGLALFALGLAEQDGYAVALGWAITAVTLVIARFVVYGLIIGAMLLARSVLGL